MALRRIASSPTPFYAKATNGVWDTSTVPGWVKVERGGQVLAIGRPFVCQAMQGQTYYVFVGPDNYRAETINYYPSGAIYGPGSNEVLVTPL